MKEVIWLGSSKKDILQFSKEVCQEIGYAIYLAQTGSTHQSVKLFKGYGTGVYEIISNYDRCTYRVIYTVKIEDAIYVIHAFKKKSKKGIKTPQEELIVIKNRLKELC